MTCSSSGVNAWHSEIPCGWIRNVRHPKSLDFRRCCILHITWLTFYSQNSETWIWILVLPFTLALWHIHSTIFVSSISKLINYIYLLRKISNIFESLAIKSLSTTLYTHFINLFIYILYKVLLYECYIHKIHKKVPVNVKINKYIFIYY